MKKKAYLTLEVETEEDTTGEDIKLDLESLIAHSYYHCKILDIKLEETNIFQFKVPESCRQCDSAVCYTNNPYCNMQIVTSMDSQMDISTCYIDLDKRPDWCPRMKLNKELSNMPQEKQERFNKIAAGLSAMWT